MVEEEQESINSLIRTNPLLLDKRDSDVIKAGNYFLPYSTGFEIECSIRPDTRLGDFLHIPNLIDLDINGYEQRFRIKEGIEGLQSLKLISDTLIEKMLFNPDSGIHYHVDCTDVYHLFNDKNVQENSEWILEELDTWEYKGTYNSRKILFTRSHNWIRFQKDFNTMEFRIGEMAFDYPTLFKRITHANDIVRRFKNTINIAPLERYEDDYEEVIKNRIIKL